jgi:hypothetical protein
VNRLPGVLLCSNFTRLKIVCTDLASEMSPKAILACVTLGSNMLSMLNSDK